MDTPQPPASILDTLRTVEFRLGLKGYNVDEVDEYLDKAAQEAEGLQEHLRQLNDRLRQASERIAQLEREKRETPAPAPAPAPVAAAEPAPASESLAVSDETLQRTLVLAQKFVDQTKRESEAEAAALIARAEASAKQIQAEAHLQLREEVGRLETTRTDLAADVESMARHLDAERSRLRGALVDLLNWVDENVQPANALLGVKSKPAATPLGAPTPPPPAEVAAAPTAPTSATSAAQAPAPQPSAEEGQPTLNLQGATPSGTSSPA